MLSMIATLKIQEGKEAEFEGIMKELAEQVRSNEDGCHLYALHRSKEPQTYVMLERYTDKDALTTHMGTEYFKAASAKMMSCLAGPPKLERLDEIL